MAFELSWRSAMLALVLETTVLALDRGPWVIVVAVALAVLVLIGLTAMRLARSARSAVGEWGDDAAARRPGTRGEGAGR